jgi:CHASE3 domain sensor protein
MSADARTEQQEIDDLNQGLADIREAEIDRWEARAVLCLIAIGAAIFLVALVICWLRQPTT